MPALSIQPTYPIFNGTDGQPLESGYIWIGAVNLNPLANPITVYWDAALTQPAGRPIRTMGGYPVNAGTPARLYVNSDYSIQVQERDGSVVYSALAATERYSGEVIEITFNDVTGQLGSDRVNFLQAGAGAVSRTAQAKMREVEISVTDYGADGTGVSDACAAIQACIAAAPAGATVVFPAGQTFRLVSDSLGYQVLIDKSLHIVATGATFNIEATVSPSNRLQERHNTIFRVLQVDGFSWRGGKVNGGRNNATVPMVAFIFGHGCKNVDVSSLVVDRMDHNFGAIGFESVLPGFSSTAAQENIAIHHNNFTRCYYGIWVRGTVNGLDISHNTGSNFDLQDPQTGYSRLGTNEYGGVCIGVYGFDGEGSTSANGNQRGVRIVGNYFDGMTQGPVFYNYASNTYTSATAYECEDVVVVGNSVKNCLSGIHINGWNQAEVNANNVTRLALSSTSGYAGTARVANTSGLSGGGIEISTAGRKLSAVGNNVISYWPSNGTTDYSGGFTGIDFGATSNTTDTATTTLVADNQISGCYIALRGTGNVLCHVTGNRVDTSRRVFENDSSPLNGGVFAEGVVEGNTFRLDGYSGTKIGAIFRGAWHVSGNNFIGDAGNQYDYIVHMLPGARTAMFTDNTLTNAVEGIYVAQSGSTVYFEGNRFVSVFYALEIVKDATSTLHVRKNSFVGANTALFFGGAGSHGTYFADRNTLLSGSWVNDSAAAVPSDLGLRSSVPGAGTFPRGATFQTTAPASAGYIGWACTVAGSPGTWKTFGLIS